MQDKMVQQGKQGRVGGCEGFNLVKLILPANNDKYEISNICEALDIYNI
jgi:hypothetical protein